MLFLSIMLPYASDEYKDVKRRTRRRPFRRVGSPNVNCMHRPTAFYRRRLAICRERGPHGFAGVNKAVAAVLTAGIVFLLTGTVGMNLVQEHPWKSPRSRSKCPRARHHPDNRGRRRFGRSPICWRRRMSGPGRLMPTRSALRATPSTKVVRPRSAPICTMSSAARMRT
jgi:hypothetical protein